ncbi:MAG TPA: aldehyde ferredoxin oxidoreductase C-terminal domain-containing protein, partial [Anaerolineae bacterium]|nr:aldehyde ferredoxin oxidoreductase C-terminal domain-containing protein [Anaerolineae bacterium]
DHCHALHDVGTVNAGPDGFLANEGLRRLGLLEPLPLEDLGPAKVRATLYHMARAVAGNCACLCLFIPWNADELMQMLHAATGWDISLYEYQKIGERALTLARLFNVREGFGPQDDRLAPRSYGPTTSGALAKGGIDPATLEAAMHTYYGMLGWDRETGIPSREKLEELDVAWAEAYLP